MMLPERNIKVLFINPPFNRFLSRVRSFGIPYGMLQMATVLENEGISARVYDADFDDVKGSKYLEDMIAKTPAYDSDSIKDPVWNEIRDTIECISPKIVGIGINTCQYDVAVRIAEISKSVDKNVPVVVGGVHPTALPEKTATEKAFDFVVFGEGEQTMLELSKALLDGREPKGVNGVCYRKGYAIIKNRPRALIKDMDAIPFPDRNLLIDVGNYPKYKLGLIMSSRGCFGRCTFCYSKRMWGGFVRFRSAGNVVDEIEYVHKKHGTYDFSIIDDTFNADTKRAEDICDMILKRGLDISWACLCRADNITGPLVEKMRRAGCHQIKLGVESGSQKVLDDMKKGISLNCMRESSRIIRDAGIELFTWFILGNFNETEETIAESEKFMEEIRPDVPNYSIMVPYPGTEAYNRAAAEGMLLSSNWSDYTGYVPIIRIDGVSTEALSMHYARLMDLCDKWELKAMKNRCRRLSYVRRKILENLHSPPTLFKLAKQALEINLKQAAD